jgi:hypothetical protein
MRTRRANAARTTDPPPRANERRANASTRAPDYARFRERFANEFANVANADHDLHCTTLVMLDWLYVPWFMLTGIIVLYVVPNSAIAPIFGKPASAQQTPTPAAATSPEHTTCTPVS